MRKSLGAVAGAVCILSAAAASAQTFDVQGFHPGPSQTHSVLDVRQARILGHTEFELGLIAHYQDSPLIYESPLGDSSDIVGSQFTLDLVGAIGLADRVEIGFGVPFILSQSGESFTSPTVPEAPDAGFGIGDIRLVPQVLFFDGNTEESPGGAALALAINTWLPTGDTGVFQGDPTVRVEPTLLFDYALPSQVVFSVNAGWLIRDEVIIGDREVDDALTWGVGVDAPVDAKDRIHLLAELNGSSILVADVAASEETAVEANAGLRVESSSGLTAMGGAGVGLIQSMDTPNWRVFFSIGFASAKDCDPDDDGIGCEGIEDQCPLIAEDFDGFEDEDGCPDDDNDGDGIRDRVDSCPDSAEDPDDFEDGDGCPDDDNDGDGIFDGDDQCPLEAEDMDGFEQGDGCPDPDNDQDGILDVDDTCPDIAEDFDGFEDEDGCHDFDNDRDGILDPDDQCPLEAEDFDGYEDEDGCPEEGAGLVTLTCERIEISEMVQFASGEATIEEESFELLNQIAAVLRGASYVRRVRIEGHTDSRGDDDFNMDLSNRRAAAVLTYLVQEGGVDVSRLISVGFGEDRPIADNDSSRGRRQNRRVEFHVVEQDSDCGTALIPDAPADEE